MNVPGSCASGSCAARQTASSTECTSCHSGSHQRGSSDLEGYWESRLAVEKDDDGVRTVTAEHREAEGGHSFRFALDFDKATRSLRIHEFRSEFEEKIDAYLRGEHPDAVPAGVGRPRRPGVGDQIG